MARYINTKLNNQYNFELLISNKDIRNDIFSLIIELEKEKSKGNDTISLWHAQVARLVEALRKKAATKGIDLGRIIINFQDKSRKYAIDIYLEKYKLGIDVDGAIGHPKEDDIKKINYYKEQGIRLLKVRSTKCEIIEDDDVILADRISMKVAEKIIAKLAVITGIDIYSYNDVKKMIDVVDEKAFIINFYFENDKDTFQTVMDKWDYKLNVASLAKVS